jgi:hypothetical protein
MSRATEWLLVAVRPNGANGAFLDSTTKYTVLSFIPLNLFQQFGRVANFYFLLSAILACIRVVSPLGSPFTAVRPPVTAGPRIPCTMRIEPNTTLLVKVAPLTFVLFMSAMKEAIEDLRRHKQVSVSPPKASRVSVRALSAMAGVVAHGDTHLWWFCSCLCEGRCTSCGGAAVLL